MVHNRSGTQIPAKEISVLLVREDLLGMLP